MKMNFVSYCLLGILTLQLISCSTAKSISKEYFIDNQPQFYEVKDHFQKLYQEKEFAIAFTDRNFNEIGFEILTDSIKYLYYFEVNGSNFSDTLQKYGYNVHEIMELLVELKNLNCTWISNLAYYEHYQKMNLVLMSFRNSVGKAKLKRQRYCVLAFFDKPQPADEKGIFLDRSNRKRQREIMGYQLYKINDRLGYAITKKFR